MEQDAHGQPGRALNWHRNLLKSVESLLGICRGLIADNQLNAAEIAFLDTWLRDTGHGWRCNYHDCKTLYPDPDRPREYVVRPARRNWRDNW